MELYTILIDLDDTLLVEVASARAAVRATAQVAAEKYGVDLDLLVDAVFSEAKLIWYNAPAREYCVRVGVSSWEGLWARFEGVDPNLKILRAFAPEYRLSVWKAAMKTCGIEDETLAEEAARTFPSERRKRHVVFDDAEPLLRMLHGKFKLGLLTNGLSCLQREKIRGSKLASYFDTITIAGDLGRRKPDAYVFEHALKGLGGIPSSSLMVGNGMRTDILGAQAAGIPAVLVKRGDDPHGIDPNIFPEYEIETLAELPPILGL